jgi:hypothetical protein
MPSEFFGGCLVGGGGTASAGALIGLGNYVERDFAVDMLGAIVAPGVGHLAERVNFANERLDVARIDEFAKFMERAGGWFGDQHDGVKVILVGFLF